MPAAAPSMACRSGGPAGTPLTVARNPQGTHKGLCAASDSWCCCVKAAGTHITTSSPALSNRNVLTLRASVTMQNLLWAGCQRFAPGFQALRQSPPDSAQP